MKSILLRAACLSIVATGLVSSPWVSTAAADPLRNTLPSGSDVYSVAFSPDGKTLASGSDDKTIRLWDPTTGKEKASLQGHEGVITSVAFSPDGKTLASGGDDKFIALWDPTKAK